MATKLPTEVASPAYWNRYSWQWTVEVGDPSGEGNRSIIQGATNTERFGIGERNGQVMRLGAKILNLFELDHSYEVIEKVNAVIDAEQKLQHYLENLDMLRNDHSWSERAHVELINHLELLSK